ncbi:MAG: metallopeptidase TldD-related protein, partial [Actinomycetota bacterium]
AKGASVYRNRVGELVASPLVTLVDDGTMTAEWGAIGIDDEGHESQRNVLIQDGILTDYMWDYLRAHETTIARKVAMVAVSHMPTCRWCA